MLCSEWTFLFIEDKITRCNFGLFLLLWTGISYSLGQLGQRLILDQSIYRPHFLLFHVCKPTEAAHRTSMNNLFYAILLCTVCRVCCVCSLHPSLLCCCVVCTICIHLYYVLLCCAYSLHSFLFMYCCVVCTIYVLWPVTIVGAIRVQNYIINVVQIK